VPPQTKSDMLLYRIQPASQFLNQHKMS